MKLSYLFSKSNKLATLFSRNPIIFQHSQNNTVLLENVSSPGRHFASMPEFTTFLTALGNNPTYTAATATGIASISSLLTHLYRQRTIKEKADDIERKSKIINTKITREPLIHQCIVVKNISQISELINIGANVNLPNFFERTPLHVAAASGDLSIAKLLITYKSDVNALDKFFNTPLHRAVSNGYPEMAKLLLKNKANPNTKNKLGDTPLHIAASGTSLELVKCLLEDINDTDVFIENALGETPLKRAYESGSREIVEYLRIKEQIIRKNATGKSEEETYVPYTLMMHAAYDQRPLSIRLLYKRGYKPDDTNNDGDTALHVAAYEGILASAIELLALKCAVDIRNKKGKTALYYAVANGHEDLMDKILEAAGDSKKSICNIPDNNNKSPLFRAAQEGYYTIFLKLLKNGAKTDVLAIDKSNILHASVLRGNLEIVTHILDSKLVDVNNHNSSGLTPIHFAVLRARIHLVELLLLNGANIDCQDVGGETPLHYAVMVGDSKLVSILLKHGASSIIKNNDDKTPINLAFDRQNMGQHYREVYQLLESTQQNEAKVSFTQPLKK